MLERFEDENGIRQTNATTYTFTVEGQNIETDEPVNQEHSISPTTLDVTSSDATLTFTIRVTDETGVDQTKLPQIQTYYSSAYSDTIKYHDLSLTSGDKKDGTYTATATIPANSISGTWNLVLERFEDENGIRQTNATTYTFTVEGQNIETDEPVNQEHSISPTTLDVTSSDATLTFTIRVTDETGVDQTKLPQIQTYYSSAYSDTIKYHDLILTSGD